MRYILTLAGASLLLFSLGCQGESVPGSITADMPTQPGNRGFQTVVSNDNPLPNASPGGPIVQQLPTPKILTEARDARDAAIKILGSSTISDCTATLTKASDLKGNQRIAATNRFSLDASLWQISAHGRLNALNLSHPIIDPETGAQFAMIGPEAIILLSPEDLSVVSVDIYSPVKTPIERL